jgi:sodium/proline symporter
MKSVAWADFFETLVMLAAAGFAFFYGMYLCGGLTVANATLAAKNPDWVKLIHTQGGPMTLMAFFSVFLVLGIGYLGQPHVMTKFYQIEKKIGLKWACVLACVTFLIVITAYYTGIWQRVLELQGKTPVIPHADLAAPIFVAQQLPAIMAGLTFAGVIAAIMSTSGAFILVASSAIVRDIIQKYMLKGRELDGPTQMKWSRMATAGVILVTCLISIKPITLVGWLGLASWGIYAATLTTPLVLGFWWRRATRPAAIAASLVGLVGGIGLFTLKQLKIYTLKMDPMGVAFMAAIVVFIVVTFMTKEEPNAYWD